MEDAVRIAVVDDVQGEQEKLCNLLLGYAARKGCRWEINRFSSGEAFLADTEREHRYNLVFLDILMNGITLDRVLKGSAGAHCLCHHGSGLRRGGL